MTEIKFYLSILYMAIICFAPIHAQDDPVANYLQQVGDYADIYNGRMETVYNILLYENLPYYMNADFTEASIIYRKNYFPNLKARLDLYREQLILLPPETQFGIIVNTQNVDKVYIYNRTFVLLNPPKESGLKQGFYMQLFEREKMQLYSKEHFFLESKQLTFNFERKIRYYLLYNGQYFTIKNSGSFSKLFPQYKKQINKFAKEQHLNFKRDAEKSFTSLADYCEELLTSTNQQ